MILLMSFFDIVLLIAGIIIFLFLMFLFGGLTQAILKTDNEGDITSGIIKKIIIGIIAMLILGAIIPKGCSEDYEDIEWRHP